MRIQQTVFFLSFCLWSFVLTVQSHAGNGDRYVGEVVDALNGSYLYKGRRRSLRRNFNDRPDGLDILMEDGRIYTGEFQFGVRQARGQWLNGDLYQGEFVDNRCRVRVRLPGRTRTAIAGHFATINALATGLCLGIPDKPMKVDFKTARCMA